MGTRGSTFYLRVLLSVLVSCAFIVFSLRGTSLAAVGSAIKAADLAPVLGYLVLLCVVHVVKTLRWGVLLRPLGHVTFRRLNAASAVGLMLLLVLPLRLGELARPLLVSRPSPGDDSRLPRMSALASCLSERVVDSIAVGVLGIISLHTIAPTGPAAKLVERAAVLLTVAFAALCIALTYAFFKRAQCVAFVRGVLGRLSPALAQRASLMVDRFIGGLRVGSASDALWFFALTVVYWGLHVWGFWLVSEGFHLDLTPLMACTVLACQVVGIMIPAGPGQVGTSQFFTQLGVSVFHPGAAELPELAARIAGYGNVIWLLQFVQTVSFGLLFLAIGHLSLRGLFDRWEDSARFGE